MKKEELDDFIYNNVIVDCHDQYEQKMSWYYYLRDELEFPFIAYAVVESIEEKSNALVSVRIDVQSLADESSIDNYLGIMIRAVYKGYIMKFPLSEIIDIRASKKVKDAVSLWKYWQEKH